MNLTYVWYKKTTTSPAFSKNENVPSLAMKKTGSMKVSILPDGALIIDRYINK